MSVPHALLALLSEGPKYGLRLQNEFEARTGEVWPLNVGQVYTTLQRLERDGLVQTDDAEGERSQKRYRITRSQSNLHTTALLPPRYFSAADSPRNCRTFSWARFAKSSRSS